MQRTQHCTYAGVDSSAQLFFQTLGSLLHPLLQILHALFIFLGCAVDQLQRSFRGFLHPLGLALEGLPFDHGGYRDGEREDDQCKRGGTAEDGGQLARGGNGAGGGLAREDTEGVIRNSGQTEHHAAYPEGDSLPARRFGHVCVPYSARPAVLSWPSQVLKALAAPRDAAARRHTASREICGYPLLRRHVDARHSHLAGGLVERREV